MNKYTIAIICLMPFLIHAQDKRKVYLDGSNQQIDHITFTKKISSGFYYYVREESDTIIYENLRYRYSFGILDPQKKSQLTKLLFSKYGIDSTKVLVIHHMESLPSPEELENGVTDYYTDMHMDTVKTRVWYPKDLENSEGFTNKEFRKWQKVKEAAFLRFYCYDNGYPIANEENTWYNDKNGILKEMFSDDLSSYPFIVVHPTGEFFVSHYLIPKEKELIDLKKFRKRREKYMRNAEIRNAKVEKRK